MIQRIKDSRTKSFITVFFVYILASIIGITLYNRLPYAFWLNLLIADVVATVVAFAFSVLFRNASIYDPYWSVQPIVILTAFAAGQSLTWLGVLLLIAVWFWGLRLTANWAYTFHGLNHQDWRYTMLKETTGCFYPVVNFFGIHLVPTLVVYGCILPAVYAIQNQVKGNAGSVLLFCVSIGATILQGMADYQMQMFRLHKTGGFIRTGLWKYARHPNYLGELLMWWGIGLAVVCAMPEQFYLCVGALANTVLFLSASIPMAEGKQSKKPGYEEYRRQTRMLLPVKKRNPNG